VVLLDTCTLLWLASDQGHLSENAKRAIMRNADALFVSAITALEIALKCRRGKLKLPLPVQKWFAEVNDFHGIRELPVTGEIAIVSVALPNHHNDPFDRVIIATARINKMKIISSDKWISQYKPTDVIW
jgi:PIN domain nuclease of toxin-antitoxin system